jgi:hypothetical protein
MADFTLVVVPLISAALFAAIGLLSMRAAVSRGRLATGDPGAASRAGRRPIPARPGRSRFDRVRTWVFSVSSLAFALLAGFIGLFFLISG